MPQRKALLIFFLKYFIILAGKIQDEWLVWSLPKGTGCLDNKTKLWQRRDCLCFSFIAY